MEKQFSTSWNSSVKPRKQRKWRYSAPAHKRHALLSAHLGKELRKKYGRRSFPLRKGDEVKVMVGNFAKKTGKITELDYTRLKVNVDGIQRSKKDGTKINVALDPSNLMILSLNLEDKKRLNSMTRGKGLKAEKKEVKK